jgi:gluconate kinase
MNSALRLSPLLIMGVAGSGKSALGEVLAKSIGCRFFDGDNFHPPANVARMRAGQPLTDTDRAGARPGHYMPESLVVSQFADLERPLGEVHTLTLNACASLPELAETARRWRLDTAPLDEDPG